MGSRRRTVRLMAMASQIAASPAGRVTAVFGGAAAREGAFRFLENDQVDAREIGAAAFRACARRAREYSYAYVPVDGTSLNISDWNRTKGLGIVGARFVGATGLQVMSALAVAPDGAPLGLCDVRYWARRGRVRRHRHDTRKLRSKETQYWLDTLTSVERTFATEARHCTPWFQLDRGGDAYPVLELCLEHGLTATVRAKANRCLWNGGAKPDTYLWTELRRQSVQAIKTVEVPARAGQPARVARLGICFADVVLDLHKPKGKQRRPGPVTAVLVRELSAPPHGAPRIEWLLLTTACVEDVEDAERVVDGYTARWTIEEFHRTWKSGACEVETTQLRARDHIIRWATILAAVSARIMRISKRARTEPELPATVELTQSEIDAIVVTKKPKRDQPGQIPTLGEAVTWLAEIGGYTGKSSGGPPGTIVLTRGMMRIQVLADYLKANGEK